MKLLYGVMATLLPILSRGQSSGEGALSIGDRLPTMALSPVLNYSTNTIQLPQATHKLLLIDFMTTGCAPCIATLPRFDSLQKAFKGQLQVLLVVPESKERVSSFLKRKNINGLQLAVLVGDTLLAKLFPHAYLPHEVLVKDGLVQAITFPEYINAKNISALLNDKPLALPVKRDVSAFDYAEPLMQLNRSIIPAFSLPQRNGYSLVPLIWIMYPKDLRP